MPRLFWMFFSSLVYRWCISIHWCSHNVLYSSSKCCDAAFPSRGCSESPAPRFSFTSCCCWASSWLRPHWALTFTRKSLMSCLVSTERIVDGALCTSRLSLEMDAFCLSTFHSSSPKPSSCGPSEGGTRVLNVAGMCVDSLPAPAQVTLRYVASEAFAVPLIMAEMYV